MPITLTGTPAIALNSSGRLQAFVLRSGAGGDGKFVGDLWQIGQKAFPPTGDFGLWRKLPPSPVPLVSNPAVVLNPQGRFELYALAGDGQLFQTWELVKGSNDWADWFLAGTVPGSDVIFSNPAITLDASQKAEVFVVGFDKAENKFGVYHRRQVEVAGGWAPLALLAWLPSSVDTMQSDQVNPVVAPSQDGRLELFIIVRDVSLAVASVYHKFQTDTQPQPRWSDWIRRGVLTVRVDLRPSVVLVPRDPSLDQSLALFMPTSAESEISGSVQFISQIGKNGINWSDWQTVDGGGVYPGSSPAAVPDFSFSTQVCATSADLRSVSQSTFAFNPFGSSGWTPWAPISPSERPSSDGTGKWLAVAIDNKENPVMFVVENNQDAELWFTKRESLLNWTPWTSLGKPQM